MSVTRTIICDACGASASETAPNEGWSGWGGLQGVAINDIANPQLCPTCLVRVTNFIDTEVFRGVD